MTKSNDTKKSNLLNNEKLELSKKYYSDTKDTLEFDVLDKNDNMDFHKWCLMRLEWTVSLSRAPIHQPEKWWSQTIDHRLIALLAVNSRYNALPTQYCQDINNQFYVTMKTVHNLCSASHTTLQKIVRDGMHRKDLIALKSDIGDKRQSIFTASDKLVKGIKNIKSWAGL